MKEISCQKEILKRKLSADWLYECIQSKYQINCLFSKKTLVWLNNKQSHRDSDYKIINWQTFYPTDDPYYCGMSARVPNFVKVNRNSRSADINSNYITSANMKKMLKEKEQKKISSSPAIAPLSTYHQSQSYGNGDSLHMASHHQQRNSLWHSKVYETGMGMIDWDMRRMNINQLCLTLSDPGESPYQIYAKLPLPTRGYVPSPRTYREWDWAKRRKIIYIFSSNCLLKL